MDVYLNIIIKVELIYSGLVVKLSLFERIKTGLNKSENVEKRGNAKKQRKRSDIFWGIKKKLIR